jgi:hypothetical protein
MSEEKEVISFEDSLPLIAKSLEAALFAGIGTSLMNIYRTYSDDVRKHSLEYTPVSFATFVKWIIDKPYYFTLNENRHLTRVYERLDDNPDAATIQKFIRFSIMWQLNVPANQKMPLGIKFERDDELNNLEKLDAFAHEFDLEKNYEFYDTVDENELLRNQVDDVYLLTEDIEKLESILNSSWELFGIVPDVTSQFWTKITEHIETRNESSNA